MVDTHNRYHATPEAVKVCLGGKGHALLRLRPVAARPHMELYQARCARPDIARPASRRQIIGDGSVAAGNTKSPRCGRTAHSGAQSPCTFDARGVFVEGGKRKRAHRPTRCRDHQIGKVEARISVPDDGLRHILGRFDLENERWSPHQPAGLASCMTGPAWRRGPTRAPARTPIIWTRPGLSRPHTPLGR